jgi:hypothetical protein
MLNRKGMPRKQAANLIDRVREMLAFRSSAEKIELMLKKEFDVDPLVPCDGQAHSPEIGGNIDNCMVCSPRWGITGDYIKIT